eukprot:scaffold1640_cov161-Amphora_coffeaeformis.AAC.43
MSLHLGPKEQNFDGPHSTGAHNQYYGRRVLHNKEKEGMLRFPAIISCCAKYLLDVARQPITELITTSSTCNSTYPFRITIHCNEQHLSPCSRALFGHPPKTVYLIRHGESIAQALGKEKRARDQSLRDCGLSEKGEEEAALLPGILGLDRYRNIDCVISSPLTRAVRTSVLGFPSKSIIIHYDLMEIGRDKNPMPENQPRRILDVMADTGGDSRIDEAHFAPANNPFPESHQNLPSTLRKLKLPKVWSAIWDYCNRRKSQEIAVVCHFNMIRASLLGCDVKPQNAIPIECRLFRDGTLELVGIISNQVLEMTRTLAELKRKNKWCMSDANVDEQDEEDQTTEENCASDQIQVW